MWRSFHPGEEVSDLVIVRLQQLRDGSAAGENRDRSARVVFEADLGINAQVTVDRRQQVLGSDRIVQRVFGPGVGLSDHLSHSQSTPGDQCTECVGPVVTAQPRPTLLVGERGAVVSLGVRPNSPQATTRIFLLRPR